MSRKPAYIEKIENLEQDVPALDRSLRALIAAAQSSADAKVATVNGVGADAAGNVKTIDSSGTNWIRYVDGIQICWGNGVSNTVTFPAAFIATPTIVSSHWTGTSPGTPFIAWASVPSKTSFTVSTYNVAIGSFVNSDLDYIAYGRWK